MDFSGAAPDAGVFTDGTMMFCETSSDAVLLHAFEHGSGLVVALLYDNEWEDPVVLTSRRFLLNEVTPDPEDTPRPTED